MNRRGFLRAGTAGLLIPFAPAIIKAGNLMPVKPPVFTPRWVIVSKRVLMPLTGRPVMGGVQLSGWEETISNTFDFERILVTSQAELDGLVANCDDVAREREPVVDKWATSTT